VLTVIVHGRNDGHGYNLHKRVALSLNCLAHLLDGDDEIIFVDWNTPDELPTLPEAIADTLTEACRRHLRILRVRPSQHRRLCGTSHLPVLDAAARNAAIRRSRSSNLWLLSTTTDVIPVLRHQGQRLSEIIGALEPALYHLPRFDVPEGLWESLDRKDPAAAIERCGAWGANLHLNEVVEADPVVRYDGPGDFQLLPMRTAFALTGFDERMVYTYHTDSNLAKRAGLLLGPVRSLLEDLFLYHCNHYRQASVHHGPIRAENSRERFVDCIETPEVPGQLETWGLVGEPVEEVYLASIGAPPHAAVLSAILAPANEPYWTVSNRAESYNHLEYRPEHVIPFVTDLLVTQPRDSVFGVFAATDGLIEALARVWTELGFAGPVYMDSFPGEGFGSAIVCRPADEIFDRAAVLLFDFGVGEQEEPFANPSSLSRLAGVEDRFREAVARERTRGRSGQASQQLFIVVNAINTVFEKLVANNLAFTYTPFTSRVRFGTVAGTCRPVGTDVAALAVWLAQKMGRPSPVPYQEVVWALDRLSELMLNGKAAQPSAPVLALLDHPRLPEALGVDRDLWRRQAALSRLERPSVRLASDLLVPTVEAAGSGAPPLNKFADVEDWDRAEWRDELIAIGEAFESANFYRRHRGTWEIAQILYAARQADVDRVDRARVVLPTRSSLPVYLSHRCRRVEVTPAGGGRCTSPEQVWPYPGIVYDPDRIEVRQLGEPADSDGFGLILLPDNAVLADGLAGFPYRLEHLDRALASGGVLIFSAEIVIAGGRAPDRLPGRLVASGALEEAFARFTGLRAIGETDWRIGAATLDRIATAGSAGEREPHFVVRIGDLLSTTAVWVLRKDAPTSPAGWAAFAQRLVPQLQAR